MIYLDYNATTPVAPEVAEGHAALPGSGVRQPELRLSPGPAGQRRRGPGPPRGGGLAQLRPGRNRLHQRGQRGQ